MWETFATWVGRVWQRLLFYIRVMDGLRRGVLLFFGVGLFAVIVLGATSYSLAVNDPWRPGEPLFWAQARSEQFWFIDLRSDPFDKADISLRLIHRRITHLEIRKETPFEADAIAYLQQNVDQTLALIKAAPAEHEEPLMAAMSNFAGWGVKVIDSLDLMAQSPQDPAAVALRDQLNRLILGEIEEPILQEEGEIAGVSDDGEEIAAIRPTATPLPEVELDQELDTSRTVLFPTSAGDTIDHSFFPLIGGHADVTCEACHTDGTYKNTPTDCIACHAGDDPHNGTFGTDCTVCHSTALDDWGVAQFDHSFIGTRDCVDCHQPPADHYPGRCTNCHIDTDNFYNVNFDHSVIGNSDCSTCHQPPANHYPGACRDCHTDTTNFGNASFNHATIGNTDCSACHAPPPNHYAGACRDCHSDTTNFANAVFNHATIGNTDCSACHAPPANHYAGACRDCHSDTTNFANAVFNHATIGNADCSACHAPPANHYAGACRDCHFDTSNFANAIFNHATIGTTDCSACHAPPANHYAGACRDCHFDTSNFANAMFNHATIGTTDCSACHAPPANHYAGACRDCHADTTNFQNATFNHATIGTTDCSACHAPPANHYAGACRDCHTDTTNFQNAAFNHSTIGNTDCSACHQPPPNHYAGACRDCHSDTSNFANATFNHTFPLNHGNANGDCQTCHAGGNTSTYSCQACHSDEKMNDKHKELNGYTQDCVQCHANGKKPGED